MTISEIKEFLKTNKITYEMLSQKSGVALNTLKSIFSGRTPCPRIDTMQAIERALGIDKDNDAPASSPRIALYEGEVSEEGMEDIERFVEFIKEREKKK